MKFGDLKLAFTRFAQSTSSWCGTPPAFALALGLIFIWFVSGPFFHYSDTWLLIIDSCTAIITFLMVFLIQNSQNRDGRLIQLKLDELIRAIENAQTALIKMDDMSDEDLKRIHEHHRLLAESADPAETLNRVAEALEAAAREDAPMATRSLEIDA